MNAVTGDPFLDGIIQNRLSHMSSTAQGFMNTANTIADVAVGMTNVGSAYEAIVGETITGQELTTFQRGVAGVGVIVPGAKIAGNLADSATAVARSRLASTDPNILKLTDDAYERILINRAKDVERGMTGQYASVKRYIDDIHAVRLTPSEIPHVHFNAGKRNVALNVDGTWKHAPPEGWTPPKKVREYLQQFIPDTVNWSP